VGNSPVRYLDSDEVKASRPNRAVHPRVQIADDFVVLAATLRRIFPLSHPDSYICIQDGAGKEVGVLRTMVGLEPSSDSIIREELDRRYFTPEIHQIEALKQEAGMWRFDVQTQRGATRFFVRNWRDNAHEISPNRWQILSVDGARFEISNLEALDAKSQRLLDQLL